MISENNKNLEYIKSEYRLMVISIENTDYYIPQEDILSFEGVGDLDLMDVERYSVGWVTGYKKKVPVYCLSSNLTLLDKSTENIKICVLFSDVNIALLCDDIRISNIENIDTLEIPECMKGESTPVDSFFLFKDKDVANEFGLLIRSISIKDYISRYSDQANY